MRQWNSVMLTRSGCGRELLKFAPEVKLSVSFRSIPGCIQQMPLRSKVRRQDALHLEKALRMLG